MNTKHWNKEAARVLVGRKIVEARYLTDKEIAGLGWHSRSVVLVLDDGSLFFPSADDEGNDAGALFGQSPGGESITLPVLRGR